jgi:hypothetical protein
LDFLQLPRRAINPMTGIRQSFPPTATYTFFKENWYIILIPAIRVTIPNYIFTILVLKS